jgi:hypothetical protein
MDYILPFLKYFKPPLDMILNYMFMTVFVFASIFFIAYLIYAVWSINKLKKPVYIQRTES